MEYIKSRRVPEDISFAGAGEYISAYIDESMPILTRPEEAERYGAFYKYFIADGESLLDLSLLSGILDNCKEGEAGVIIVNPPASEVVDEIKGKSYMMVRIGGEGIEPQLDIIRHLLTAVHTGDSVLELDDAELRGVFNSPVGVASFVCDIESSAEAIGEGFARAIGGLKPRLVCAVASSENNKTPEELCAKIGGIISAAAEQNDSVLWNIYTAELCEKDELRVFIVFGAR